MIAAIAAVLQVSVAPAARPAVPEYDMRIVRDPSGWSLSVSGTVRLPPFAHPADSLRFLLWSGAREVRFRITSSTEPLTVRTDSADGDRVWFLRHARAFAPGAPITVAFSYRVDSANAPQFRVRPDGAFAGGGGEIWYPRLGFDSTAVGTLRFEMSDRETVLASGHSIPSLGTSPAHTTFRVTRPQLFTFTSAVYETVRAPLDSTVILYLKRHRADAADIAARAAGTLRVLASLFGPLPDSQYAIAEVDFGGSVAGTSEASFFLADGSRLDEGFSLPFFGHEIGHAWWGNIVRSRPATVGRMMLSEGLAQYGMLQVIARIEGEAAAERFRRGEYPGSTLGGGPREYFRLSAAGLEVPLTAFAPAPAQVLPMHRMANTRGFFVLDMLGRRMGQERFRKLLQDFVREHAGSATSWDDLIAAVARAGAEHAAFLNDWLRRTGAPMYTLEWHVEIGRISGHVRQTDSLFDARLEIELFGQGQRMVKLVDAHGADTRFEWAAPFSIDSLSLDPHYRTLRWTPMLRRFATELAGYTRADWERRFGDRRRALERYRTALDSLPRPDPFGAEFLVRLGLVRALASAGDSAAATAQLDSALASPVRHTEWLPLAYVDRARFARQAHDEKAFERFAAAAESAELVAGTRTGALDQLARLRQSKP